MQIIYITVVAMCVCKMEERKIPTFQPFQDSAVTSGPPPALGPRQASHGTSRASTEETAAIFENRDLLFSLLSEDVNTLLHPHPTFITPLANYLNLNFDHHDLLSLHTLLDQDTGGGAGDGGGGGGRSQYNASSFQRKTNIQQLDLERRQRYQDMEFYLREQYLVCLSLPLCLSLVMRSSLSLG